VNDAVRLRDGVGGLTDGAQSATRPARTLGIVYVASGLSLAGNQLFTILLFFLLPASLAGLINWGTASGALVFYIAEGGVETALVIAAKRTPMSLGRMMAAVGSIRAVTAAIALGVWGAATLFHWVDAQQATVLLLVGTGFVLRSLQTPFTAALVVSDRQATAAVLNLSGTVVRMAALALVWWVSLVSVPSVLVASLVGDVAGLVGLAVICRRLTSTAADIPIRRLIQLLRRAAPAITASQAVSIAQARVDWLLVAAFTSYASLANYSIANKALELFILAGSVFGRTALPWFVDGWNSRKIIGSVRALLAAVSVGGLGLALAGAAVLHAAFGDKYAGADQVIPILAALAPGLVALLIVQFAMLGKDRAIDTVIAGGAGIAVQVIFDLLAIPRLGIGGAAYGMWAFTLVALPASLLFATGRRVIAGRVALELVGTSAILPALLVAGRLLVR
jgi:O-antigen/teichoic acid export membrane protein